MKETIVTGRKFRRLADEAQNLWQRISFWTKASDLEFDDGKTAESKLGEIDGITSDLSGEDTRIAASIKAVNSVDNKFGGVSQFIVDEESGKITGYKTDIGGADTVFPFNGEHDLITIDLETYTATVWGYKTEVVPYEDPVINGKEITVTSGRGGVIGTATYIQISDYIDISRYNKIYCRTTAESYINTGGASPGAAPTICLIGDNGEILEINGDIAGLLTSNSVVADIQNYSGCYKIAVLLLSGNTVAGYGYKYSTFTLHDIWLS